MWGVKTSQHLNQMRITVSKRQESKIARKPAVSIQLLWNSLTVQLQEKQPSHQFCGIILFFNPNSSTDSSFHEVQLQRQTSTSSRAACRQLSREGATALRTQSSALVRGEEGSPEQLSREITEGARPQDREPCTAPGQTRCQGHQSSRTGSGSAFSSLEREQAAARTAVQPAKCLVVPADLSRAGHQHLHPSEQKLLPSS